MAAKDDYLIDILVDMGLVNNQQLAAAREETGLQRRGPCCIFYRKIVRPVDVAQAKAAHFGYEFINLSEMRLTDDVIAAVPRNWPSGIGRYRWPSTTTRSWWRWPTVGPGRD